MLGTTIAACLGHDRISQRDDYRIANKRDVPSQPIPQATRSSEFIWDRSLSRDTLLSEVLPEMERLGLWVTDIEILRLHYAETLRQWRERFQARRDEVKALYDERFCRMWEFYLAACEVSFRHCGSMVFQMQLTRSIDAVPLTRDYMVEAERRSAAGIVRAA